MGRNFGGDGGEVLGFILRWWTVRAKVIRYKEPKRAFCLSLQKDQIGRGNCLEAVILHAALLLNLPKGSYSSTFIMCSSDI